MDYKINTRVENISRRTTKKDGTPYTDKNKKDFTVVSIKLSDRLIDDPDWKGWCSVMDYGNDFMYREGDVIKGYVSKRIVDDKLFWNFRKPSKIDELEERVEALEEKVSKMGQDVPQAQVKEEYPIDEEVPVVEDEDIDLSF